jgi:uncharacterized protein
MLPMVKQVQLVTDFAKGTVCRLAGREIPKFDDTETTIAELQARVSKTAELVKSFKASEIDGQEEREITLKVGPSDMTFPGQTYLVNFALPNLYFHASMAYAIARKNGVPLGKANFMGRA